MDWTEANGASLRYDLSGSGPETVVLIHEVGGCIESWDEAHAAFRQQFRVLRYDVRGHGASDVPAGPYTLQQMSADLFELLDSLGITETHFVGVSMGGLIGMTAALERPERITRTRVAKRATTPRSCVIQITAMPIRRRRFFTRSMICA